MRILLPSSTLAIATPHHVPFVLKPVEVQHPFVYCSLTAFRTAAVVQSPDRRQDRLVCSICVGPRLAVGVLAPPLEGVLLRYWGWDGVRHQDSSIVSKMDRSPPNESFQILD